MEDKRLYQIIDDNNETIDELKRQYKEIIEKLEQKYNKLLQKTLRIIDYNVDSLGDSVEYEEMKFIELLNKMHKDEKYIPEIVGLDDCIFYYDHDSGCYRDIKYINDEVENTIHFGLFCQRYSIENILDETVWIIY